MNAEEITSDLRKIGYNIIPIVAGTKMPLAGSDVMKWKKDGCDVKINPDDSIAMLHGIKGGTWASDFDDPTILDDLIKDEKKKSGMMIVKTPKQGHHIIWAIDKDDQPPKDTSFIDSKKRKIDIRCKGYTLLPPSIHPDKALGRYQFLNENMRDDLPGMSWSVFLNKINSLGFFSSEDKLESGTKGKKYQYAELVVGKFRQGERRKKQKSLYIQKRISGSTEEKAREILEEINATCLPPFTGAEFEANMRSAESFYINVAKEDNEKIKHRIEEEEPNCYTLANVLMKEYEFISHISKEIYFYGNGVYIPHGEELIHNKSRKYWEEIEISTGTINEIVSIIRDKKIEIPHNQNQEMFNLDFNKIILINGIFDLKTNTFEDHTHKVLSTIKHPIYFDDKKECPKFHKFLKSCFDGDEHRITQVWEMMALCFIKNYIIQKGYVNYGIGSNGKSTFLNILRNMIGIYNTCSIPMQAFQNSTFMGHELKGKCCNISADGGVEPITKTGFIKQVLGGDALRCEQKYHNPFDIVPFVTLIFTFNELPSVTDSSDGFARKIQTIHWDQRFYNEDRDKEVDKLPFDTDERSGIFNELIPIMQRLLKTRKLSYESTVEHTKAIWLSRSDSFFRFRTEMLVKSSKHEIEVSELLKQYIKYCETVGMTAYNKRLFNDELIQWIGHDTRVKKRDSEQNNIRVWRGFTLKSVTQGDNESLDIKERDHQGYNEEDIRVTKDTYKKNYRTEPDE